MDGASVTTALSQEARAALRDLLCNYWDLGDLQQMCFNLGIDWDELPGEKTKPAKAAELIEYMRKRGRLNELFDEAKEERRNIARAIERIVETLSSSREAGVVTYFIATDSEDRSPARFGITGDEFKQTFNYQERDCIIIFDLSKPPKDWLKYVPLQERGLPAFDRIIFVALEGIAELPGTSVHDILFRPYGLEPVVWQSQREFLNKLKDVRTTNLTQAIVRGAVGVERQQGAR